MIGALSHRHDAWLRQASRHVARARRAAAFSALWRRRARERRLLAAFDDRMLRDIGVSRLDALRECGKPFWRA